MKTYIYHEHDYLKLKLGQSFCFIDIMEKEIFFPCILSYIDDYTFRDYQNESLNSYEDYNVNNNELLIVFRDQREAALIGKHYIILEYDNDIKSCLNYFKNNCVRNYIFEVCNKKIYKIPKHGIPDKFNDNCVNIAIKNLENRYSNDLQIKKNKKIAIISIGSAILIGIISLFFTIYK